LAACPYKDVSAMSFLRYIREVLRRAIEPAWKLTDTISTILGLLAGLLTWLLTRVQPYIEVATWAIPIAILLPLFLYRLLTAPYFLLVEQRGEAESANRDLASIRQSRPCLRLSSIRDAQLFHDGNPIFRPIQAWFTNAPENPLPGSTAYSVSAVIEFTSEAEPPRTIRVFGQWALTDCPDFVGYRGLASTTDIPPSHIPAKLMIALKHTEDSSAYAFSIEGLRRSLDGRDTNHELPPGIYRVMIHIRGVGVDESFTLRLENDGPGSIVRLTVPDDRFETIAG
jgi:hypothetical protein